MLLLLLSLSVCGVHRIFDWRRPTWWSAWPTDCPDMLTKVLPQNADNISSHYALRHHSFKLLIRQ